jgi:transposase
MRENDGRKLDHKTLEALRLRAVEQVLRGLPPEYVASALGLHRKTVYGWVRLYREGGHDALLAKPVPGRPPLLGPAQIARLWALIIDRNPRQAGFGASLWTSRLIGDLVLREFGLSLSAASVMRLTVKMGIDPPRTVWEACRGAPGAITRWKHQEYPALARRAAAARATICFADEASLHTGRLDGQRDGEPDPAGCVIHAVPTRGTPGFAAFRGDSSAVRFTEFCRLLVDHAPGPVFLVVGGHPAHHAAIVRDYAKSMGGRLELCPVAVPGGPSAY